MRIKVLSGGRKSIELPLSDAELNFQMKRIGIEEIVPVCRLVEASEKDNPLCKFEGQTVKMDEVNFFAKRLDCFTEYERKVLYSYVTALKYVLQYGEHILCCRDTPCHASGIRGSVWRRVCG